MSDIYGRSLSELTRQGPSLASFAVQFRSALRPVEHADVPETAEAVETFRRWCGNYSYLEALLRAGRPTTLPKADGPGSPGGLLPERAGELAARTERNLLGLGDGPAGDLRALLEEEHGLRVFFLDLPGKVAGMFAYSQEYGGCVAVNRKHPIERRLWSMAHEYGHFVTDPYKADVLRDQGPGSSAAERTADAFARHFLLPDQAVARRFDQLQRQGSGEVTPAGLIGLADYFGVSFQAMIARLEQLKRLPSGTWQRLSRQGFRVREAQAMLGYAKPAASEDAFPKRYLPLAVWAFAEGRISEGQLAELLGLDRLSARERVQQAVEHAGAEDLESLAGLLSGRLF